MASAEHEPMMGVSPQRGPGAEPLVRGAKPKLKVFFVIACPTGPVNLAHLVRFSKYRAATFT